MNHFMSIQVILLGKSFFASFMGTLKNFLTGNIVVFVYEVYQLLILSRT